MANPPTAQPFPQELAPGDRVEFYTYLYQGDPSKKPAPLLLPGEGVASYELRLTPEAIAVGFQIDSESDRLPFLNGNLLRMWVSIAEEMQALPVFAAGGVVVGVEMPIDTTNIPDRSKTRTILFRIAKQ